ncbi:hypothetical protein M8818_001060 [Zalaria obscura]|uniref:Uncharacterized protein n=1 Tax=Zalaria obscura TaxID=2024903 RepID=A0ACC3SM66_9PEZI
MAGPRYTVEVLLRLRDSPLVQRPEDLPSIEQWMEAKPAQTFPFAEPPDDIVLGPPKTSFASSRNINRLAESNGKTLDDEDAQDDTGSSRSRFFRDRDVDRNQARGGFGAMQKTGREARDSWTSSRAMKTFGDEEDRHRNGEKERPYGRNQRDHERNADGEDFFGRKNGGFGQKADSRWSRDSDRNMNRPQEKERGWRDRERRNDREFDSRGGQEQDPEWMDEPLEKVDKRQAHTQEEFQRWKERMKAGSAPQNDEPEPAPKEVASPAAALRQSNPLVLESGVDKLFGGSWGGGEAKQAEIPIDGLVQTPRAATSKGKSSRFASLFAPKEEVARPVAEPASPSINFASNGSSEDKEAFQRILMKLQKTNITPQSTTPQEVASPLMHDRGNNAFGGALFADPAIVEHQRMPSHPQSPQEPIQGLFNKRPESGQHFPPRFEAGIPPHGPTGENSNLERLFGHDGRQGSGSSQLPSQNRPSSIAHPDGQPSNIRPSSGGLGEPAPRSTNTPESVNIQNLIAGQQKNGAGSLNASSQILLDMIKKQANRPPSQARGAPEPDNFQLFLDEPPKPQTHAPRPRVPPMPGFMDDQFFQQQEPRMHDQMASPDNNPAQPMQGGPRRVPPGFFEDPSIVAQQNQRNYPKEPPLQRRQSGHPGLPQGPPFPHDFPFPGGQPFPPQGPPSQQERLPPPPPPGFNPNLRHPPGFANIPNIFQQPTAQPHPGQQGPPPPHMQPRQGLGMPEGPGPGPGPAPGHFMPPPPGFFGGPAHMPGAPPGIPPMHGGMLRSPLPQDGMMRSPQEGIMRSPQEGMMPMGRGFEGPFGGMAPRR